jgi:hypothetical protein
VSHNGGKLLPLDPTTKKPLLLYPTTEENIFHCGIQCGRFFWDSVNCIRFCCGVGYNGRKISCVVGYNRKNLIAIL